MDVDVLILDFSLKGRPIKHGPSPVVRTAPDQWRLADLGIDATVSATGSIWHIQKGSQVVDGLSEALWAGGQISSKYAPAGIFRRDFSSLLGMEVIRSLRGGQRGSVSVADVEKDVLARLNTTALMVDWLIRQNASAQEPFLRLDKQPFRFQTTIDPLNAEDRRHRIFTRSIGDKSSSVRMAANWIGWSKAGDVPVVSKS